MVPYRYIITVLVLLTIAAALTAGVTFYFWLPGWMPPVIFLMFGVAPVAFAAFIGGFVIDPTKTKDAFVTPDSPSVTVRLRAALAPIFGWGLLLALVLMGWQMEEVRAEAGSQLADLRIEWVGSAAITDPSEVVLVKVCEALDRNEMHLSLAGWIPLLLTAGDDLTTCLVESLPADSGTGNLIVGMSANGWAQSIMREDIAPEDACLRAEWLRRSIRLGHDNGALELFSCTIHAPSDVSRSCCANAIRAESQGMGIGAIVGSPAQMIASPWRTSLGGFMAAVGDEQQTEAVRMAVGTERESFLQWSVLTACMAFDDLAGDDRYALSARVGEVVSTPECELPRMTDTSIQIWSRGCDLTYNSDSASSDMWDLCPNTRGSLVADTMAESQRMMNRALSRAKKPSSKSSIFQQLMNYPKNRKKPKFRLRPGRSKLPVGSIDSTLFKVGGTNPKLNDPRVRALLQQLERNEMIPKAPK